MTHRRFECFLSSLQDCVKYYESLQESGLWESDYIYLFSRWYTSRLAFLNVIKIFMRCQLLPSINFGALTPNGYGNGMCAKHVAYLYFTVLWGLRVLMAGLDAWSEHLILFSGPQALMCACVTPAVKVPRSYIHQITAALRINPVLPW